jgi:hypothetical protein
MGAPVDEAPQRPGFDRDLRRGNPGGDAGSRPPGLVGAAVAAALEVDEVVVDEHLVTADKGFGIGTEEPGRTVVATPRELRCAVGAGLDTDDPDLRIRRRCITVVRLILDRYAEVRTPPHHQGFRRPVVPQARILGHLESCQRCPESVVGFSVDRDAGVVDHRRQDAFTVELRCAPGVRVIVTSSVVDYQSRDAGVRIDPVDATHRIAVQNQTPVSGPSSRSAAECLVVDHDQGMRVGGFGLGEPLDGSLGPRAAEIHDPGTGPRQRFRRQLGLVRFTRGQRLPQPPVVNRRRPPDLRRLAGDRWLGIEHAPTRSVHAELGPTPGEGHR